MGWAVAFTHPLCETKAVINAARQGFVCYLPKILNRKTKRVEPLFPRYFFVEVLGAWRSLSNTVGVASVLLNGDRPALVEDVLIEGIRKRCDESGHYIGFRHGQPVVVEKSGLSGLYAGMHGKDRAYVLLNLLGSQVRADVRESDLVAA